MKTLQQLLLEDDGKLRVKGNITQDKAKLFFDLGLEIDELNGFFDCNSNNLTSLVGCPTIVNGTFNCIGNNLTSLVGCPTIVNGWFSCDGNNLTSLETGLPDGKKVFVKHDFYYKRRDNNDKLFTRYEVKKYFDVKGTIFLS